MSNNEYTPTTSQVLFNYVLMGGHQAGFIRWLAERDARIEAAAEQRGAYRAACQAFRYAATAFDYPEAGDQHCTWADVAKWLRANADKHDPDYRADRIADQMEDDDDRL